MQGATEKETTHPRWTVMVYFAADNNLYEYGVADLELMKKVGSTDEVKLIAQLDPTGDRRMTRYCLQRDTFLEEDIVDRGDNINTGDPNELVNFVRWSVNKGKYRAQHYMLVIWGHGHGWQGEGDNPCRAAGRTVAPISKRNGTAAAQREDPSRTNSVAPEAALDSASKDFLESSELKQALDEIQKEVLKQKINILGMDACLMAMAEVGYQVRDSVDYLVGSEEAVPTDSWPYDSILAQLIKNPEMTPEQLAIAIVRKYILYYQDKKFVTQSVCDLARAENLAHAVGELAGVLIKRLPDHEVRRAVMTSRAMAQSFYIKDYVDLYNFCELLRENCPEAEEDIRSVCDKVMQAIRGKREHDGQSDKESASKTGFVVDYGFCGYPVRDANGVSIYFPYRDKSPCYNNLDFSKKTRWHEFLDEYVGRPQGARARSSRKDGSENSTNGLVKTRDGDSMKVPSDPIRFVPEFPKTEVSQSASYSPIQSPDKGGATTA